MKTIISQFSFWVFLVSSAPRILAFPIEGEHKIVAKSLALDQSTDHLSSALVGRSIQQNDSPSLDSRASGSDKNDGKEEGSGKKQLNPGLKTTKSNTTTNFPSFEETVGGEKECAKDKGTSEGKNGTSTHKKNHHHNHHHKNGTKSDTGKEKGKKGDDDHIPTTLTNLDGVSLAYNPNSNQNPSGSATENKTPVSSTNNNVVSLNDNDINNLQSNNKDKNKNTDGDGKKKDEKKESSDKGTEIDDDKVIDKGSVETPDTK